MRWVIFSGLAAYGTARGIVGALAAKLVRYYERVVSEL